MTDLVKGRLTTGGGEWPKDMPVFSLNALTLNFWTYRYGDAAFFMLDTRRYRSPNKQVDDENKTMLGEEQKAVFLDWLASVRLDFFRSLDGANFPGYR
jgi:hypothetical protein